MSSDTLVPDNDETPRKKSRKGIGGRPTIWREEFLQLAYRYALLGASDKKIIEWFGVSERIFYQWKAQKPEFAQMLNKGRQEADGTVANSLFRSATGYYKKTEKSTPAGPVTVREWFPPGAAQQIFWLKNRAPEFWKDKQQHDHTHTVTISGQFEDLIRQINENKQRVIEGGPLQVESKDFAPTPAKDAAE
jgi:hypothetical protein